MLGRQKGCQQCFHSFATLWNWDFNDSTQILPHFSIAELQAYILEGGLGNEIKVKGEKGAETAPESHTRDLNFKYLTIRECDKFDIGSRRSYMDWSLCFRLSQALAFTKNLSSLSK